MRIAILTQDDKFFIPAAVSAICEEPGLTVTEITIIHSKGALAQKKLEMLRMFGVGAIARLALKQIATLGRSFIGAAATPATLQAVAAQYNIAFHRQSNINDPAVIQRLKSQDLDVIVSFSAPQVFRDELLNVPARGCLNLHCSLLPRYKGMLPSFWVLYHGEKKTGATVHRMDANIDTGAILKQVEVDISHLHTMFDVIGVTKRAGGAAMLEVLRELAGGNACERENPADEGSYFSWPSMEDARRFRKKGMRLA